VDTDAASLTRALESLRERVRVEVRLLLRAHLRHVRAEAGTKDATARARMLAYYRMIGAAPKTEHLDAGERLLTEALAADASYGPALVERAYLRLVRASSQRAPEALKGALDDLGRAIAIAPRDPSARVMRCRALQFAVEFRGAPTDTSLEEASRECGLALELDPDSVPVRLVLARLHDRRCEDDPAMETLERALEVDRAYEGRILEHLVGLAMQNERLPLADTLSARLLAYEAEERRLGPRSPSRRAGVPSSSHAALVRGGILLRLRKLDDARRVLRAQLERSAAGLGDKAVEAASIRGLLRAGSREASLERRLRELEGEFDVARRAQPAIALRVASFYSWSDPVAAARWLDRLATPGGCTEAINRALLYAGTGQARGARAALASCTPTQSWEKRCAAFVERRIQR
jgi:tetratricopeptide (TPR) repeat protein